MLTDARVMKSKSRTRARAGQVDFRKQVEGSSNGSVHCWVILFLLIRQEKGLKGCHDIIEYVDGKGREAKTKGNVAGREKARRKSTRRIVKEE
jgi:hypothetical protein